MDWKKLGKMLLFPHVAVLLLLLPLSAAALVYSMLFLEESNPVRIASYALSFYTLTIGCARIPATLRFFRALKAENQILRRWSGDTRLRMNVTLTGCVLWNSAYAALQLGLGIRHKSAWFYALAIYYLSLAVMRFFLVRHTWKHPLGEELRQELKRYRVCGWIFLFMNVALTAMIFFMIRQNRAVHHHEITAIATATYTFASLSMAIVNVIRYRKYNSPAMSASKAISLASACVSMLTLENAMLTTFNKGNLSPQTQKTFLSVSGGAISMFIIIMALYMIIRSSQKMKEV